MGIYCDKILNRLDIVALKPAEMVDETSVADDVELLDVESEVDETLDASALFCSSSIRYL